MDPVNERVVWLIDHFHGKRGVNRAAAHSGVAQSTLQRVYTGERKPSLDVVRRIVEAYPGTGLTMDWLVSGRGEPPRIGVEIAGQTVTDPEWVSIHLAFNNALRAAGVQENSPLNSALLSMNELVFRIVLYAEFVSRRAGSANHAIFEQVQSKAARAVTEGWTSALQAIAGEYGPEASSRALLEQLPEIACQFEPFLRWLEDKDRVARAQLAEWYSEYLHDERRLIEARSARAERRRRRSRR